MKKIWYGFLALICITNLLVMYLWMYNFFAIQYAWRHCIDIKATYAVVVDGKAYCSVVFAGDSYMGELNRLEESYNQKNK